MILKQCQGHPNIVNLIDVFTDEVMFECNTILQAILVYCEFINIKWMPIYGIVMVTIEKFLSEHCSSTLEQKLLSEAVKQSNLNFNGYHNFNRPMRIDKNENNIIHIRGNCMFYFKRRFH